MKNVASFVSTNISVVCCAIVKRSLTILSRRVIHLAPWTRYYMIRLYVYCLFSTFSIIYLDALRRSDILNVIIVLSIGYSLALIFLNSIDNQITRIETYDFQVFLKIKINIGKNFFF